MIKKIIFTTLLTLICICQFAYAKPIRDWGGGVRTGAQLQADATLLSLGLDNGTTDYYTTLDYFIDWLELETFILTGTIDLSGATVTYGNDKVPIESVYSGTTSLEEANSGDSGAGIIGVYANDISNSTSENMQDVAEDLSDAIDVLSAGKEDASTYLVKSNVETIMTKPHTQERGRKTLHTSEPMFTGDHYGTASNTILNDPDANNSLGWTVDALIGRYVHNTTDGETALITDNDGTTVTTAAMSAAWDATDVYEIVDVNLWDVINVDNENLDPSDVIGDGPYSTQLVEYGDPLVDGNVYKAIRSKAGDAYFSALATKNINIVTDITYNLGVGDLGKRVWVSKTDSGTVDVALPDCDTLYLGGDIEVGRADIDPDIYLTLDGTSSDPTNAIILQDGTLMTAGNKATIHKTVGNRVLCRCITAGYWNLFDLVAAAATIDGGAGSGCVPNSGSPIYDVTTNNGSNVLEVEGTGDAYGQRVKHGSEWDLGDIQIQLAAGTGSGIDVVVRFGTSSDLSGDCVTGDCEEEWVFTTDGGAQLKVLTSETNYTCASDTYYYWGAMLDTGESGTVSWSKATTDQDADADAMPPNSGWAMGTASGTVDRLGKVLECTP